jgi:SAM-dependent methyltransferase
MRSMAGRRLWWQTRGRRSELQFWAAWLAGSEGAEEWARDRERRFTPDAEVADPLLRSEIERLAKNDLSVLDVGAGPVTYMGFRYPGTKLEIVAVDPLANEYARLLEAAGLEPPVRTLPVAGEALLHHFGPGRFDIAYAHNSLDHSVDPLRIIANMVGVVREGGSVILRHAQNEGQEQRYEGLHQWNFDVAQGDLIVWNTAVTVNVSSALQQQATVEAWIEPHDQQGHVLARLVVNGGDLAHLTSA